jgi:hypothetical protein
VIELVKIELAVTVLAKIELVRIRTVETVEGITN